MFRLSGVFSIILATFCGALLFWTSQSVQRAEQKLSETSKYVLNENETLRVLSAEWDYLNRPERLEALSNNNLGPDASLADGKVFVKGADKIPEPMVPVIPKTKPTNLFQHVSVQKKSFTKPKPPSVIEKSDSQNFDKLLSNVATGGQP